MLPIALEALFAVDNRFRISSTRAIGRVNAGKLRLGDVEVVGAALDIFCSISHLGMLEMNSAWCQFVDHVHRALGKLHQACGGGFLISDGLVEIRLLPDEA